MYYLKNNNYIAKGLHRECYVHPQDVNLCIKVVVNGDDSETLREQSYYAQLKKKNVSWAMLPRFHGNVDTDIGTGAVFDLIRDANGEIAKSLSHYLVDPALTEVHKLQLLNAFKTLKDYLHNENIMTMTLKCKNIVFQKCSNYSKLVIVDNIGNSDFIPIASSWRFLGVIKNQRKWQYFEQALLALYPGNQALKEIVKRLRLE